MEASKRGLCAFDDKRFIQDDGINTFAYGHKDITSEVLTIDAPVADANTFLRADDEEPSIAPDNATSVTVPSKPASVDHGAKRKACSTDTSTSNNEPASKKIRKDSISWQVARKVYKAVFQGVVKQKRVPQLAEELTITLFCN